MPKVATTIDVGAVLAGFDAVDPADPVETAVLEAAADLLVSSGIAAVEVDVVAERSNVGRSTIYRRFGSRNELLAATLAFEARRFFVLLAAQVDDVADPGDRVAEAFARGLAVARAAGLADLVRGEPILLQLLTIDGAPLVAAARDQLVAEVARRVPTIEVDVVRGQADVLIRLAISHVLTPERDGGDVADRAVVETVRRIVSVAMRGTTGEP